MNYEIFLINAIRNVGGVAILSKARFEILSEDLWCRLRRQLQFRQQPGDDRKEYDHNERQGSPEPQITLPGHGVFVPGRLLLERFFRRQCRVIFFGGEQLGGNQAQVVIRRRGLSISIIKEETTGGLGFEQDTRDGIKYPESIQFDGRIITIRRLEIQSVALWRVIERQCQFFRGMFGCLGPVRQSQVVAIFIALFIVEQLVKRQRTFE